MKVLELPAESAKLARWQNRTVEARADLLHTLAALNTQQQHNFTLVHHTQSLKMIEAVGLFCRRCRPPCLSTSLCARRLPVSG